jgi:hypothetical protein
MGFRFSLDDAANAAQRFTASHRNSRLTARHRPLLAGFESREVALLCVGQGQAIIISRDSTPFGQDDASI